MKLLVFAHRGEAQTFLKYLDVKSVKDMNDLYIGDEVSVLLCGEGILQASCKLSFALGKLTNRPEVINMGICGALDQDVPLNSIHHIRTIYAEDEFKSFSSEEHTKIDLITAKKRALNLDDSNKLSIISQLVDREAWGLAHTCKELGASFKAIKLVSDHITDAEVCKMIKDQSDVFSDMLFEHYQELVTKSEEEGEGAEDIEYMEIFSNKDFYLTVSQKRQYKNLIKAIITKEGITEKQIELSEFTSLDKTPKERTKLLLSSLNRRLFPFKTKIQDRLESLTNEMKFNGADFKFDKNFEKVSFNFSAHIDSEKAKDHMSELLKKFSWSDFEKVMKGELDV